MASHNLEGTSVEERGLLRSTSFEIDDVESAEQNHKQTIWTGEDWLDVRRFKGKCPAWSRPRNILIGLAVTLAVVGMAILIVFSWREEVVYKEQRYKIKEAIISETNAEQMAKTSRLSKLLPTAVTPAIMQSTPISNGTQSTHKFEKPQGFKIIALIFYGRAPVVAILDCYLKKNLLSNGGFLDEVHWAVNTDNEEDLRYLDELVKTTTSYKKIAIPSFGYNSIWEHAVQPENLYIKIDDDIVYMTEDAIPNLVFSKLKHPKSLNVVANLVNSPETGWLHYHVGAVHAYLPEYEHPAPDVSGTSYGPKAWRASALPQWGEKVDLEKSVAQRSNDGSDMMGDQPASPPFKGHRWLPLPKGEDGENLSRTPIARTKYDAFGTDWTSWAIGAQVHYSLLENIENNQLSKYHYGSGLDDTREGIWNMAYERMNINFMAIWGSDIVENIPFEDQDDEQELSINLPLKLQRPLLVNTHVIAAHFSFRTQRQMYETDLLSRYRAYANEMVCTPDNQINKTDF